MKIRDVIYEENPLTKWAAKGISKLFPTTAGRVASRSDAYDLLKNAWANEIQTHGKMITSADKLVGAKYAADASLINGAAKEAAKIAKKAKYTANVAAMETSLGKAGSAAVKIGISIGWGDAIYEAYTEISELNDKLAKKQITPDQYDNDVRYYLGQCVTKIAAMGVASGAFKLGGAVIKSIPILPFAGTIGSLVSSLSGTAAAGFGLWLMSPEGSKQFAEWYVSNTFSAMIARTWIGGMSKAAYDYIVRSIDQIKSGQAPDMPFSDKNDKDGQGAFPVQSSKKIAQYDPVTKTWSDGDW